MLMQRMATVPDRKPLAELRADNLGYSDQVVQINDFKNIASYNWLDRSEPTILVPGA